MRKILVVVPFLVSGMAFAETGSPVATVSSRAPFVLQGVMVPVVGSTSWPAMEGDVVEAKTAPAEVRLKDGTRIMVPQGARVVVSSSIAHVGAAPAASGASKAVSIAPVRSAVVAKQHGAVVGGLLNILDGGAYVVKSSMLETLAIAAGPKTAGDTTSAVFSEANLALQYGPYNPIISEIDKALKTSGRMIQFDAATNTYYITGVQAIIGNGAPQTVTFVIRSNQIVIEPGTVGPGSTLPPALVTVTPSNGGTPTLCKGGSLAPPDVSNSAIRITSPGVC